MNKKDLLLVALSAGGAHAHTPVQVQKLLFLIDKNAGHLISGGTGFNFVPYSYGPFDSSIYEELRALIAEGLVVEDVFSGKYATHSITEKGAEEAADIASSMDKAVVDYIDRASEFVRGLSFSQLVSSIYKAYPEMKENSVFRG